MVAVVVVVPAKILATNRSYNVAHTDQYKKGNEEDTRIPARNVPGVIQFRTRTCTGTGAIAIAITATGPWGCVGGAAAASDRIGCPGTGITTGRLAQIDFVVGRGGSRCVSKGRGTGAKTTIITTGTTVVLVVVTPKMNLQKSASCCRRRHDWRINHCHLFVCLLLLCCSLIVLQNDFCDS